MILCYLSLVSFIYPKIIKLLKMRRSSRPKPRSSSDSGPPHSSGFLSSPGWGAATRRSSKVLQERDVNIRSETQSMCSRRSTKSFMSGISIGSMKSAISRQSARSAKSNLTRTSRASYQSRASRLSIKSITTCRSSKSFRSLGSSGSRCVSPLCG